MGSGLGMWGVVFRRFGFGVWGFKVWASMFLGLVVQGFGFRVMEFGLLGSGSWV